MCIYEVVAVKGYYAQELFLCKVERKSESLKSNGLEAIEFDEDCVNSSLDEGWTELDYRIGSVDDS